MLDSPGFLYIFSHNGHRPLILLPRRWYSIVVVVMHQNLAKCSQRVGVSWWWCQAVMVSWRRAWVVFRLSILLFNTCSIWCMGTSVVISLTMGSFSRASTVAGLAMTRWGFRMGWAPWIQILTLFIWHVNFPGLDLNVLYKILEFLVWLLLSCIHCPLDSQNFRCGWWILVNKGLSDGIVVRFLWYLVTARTIAWHHGSDVIWYQMISCHLWSFHCPANKGRNKWANPK